ncbi:DUF2207 domain-containing protein, partial [bacterium]|nr:DUF2207 domain-containing protein [bacterium]
MKKLLFIVLSWMLLFCPAFAENFYIQNYNVNIDVDKNKSANIIENIDVYFTYPSHGIYRKIPYKNASITNINVSEYSDVSYNESDVNIKIGDPDKLIEGLHSYIISYKYNYQDNKNEFYHNIIGTDWNVPIKHASFIVNMPEEVDPSKAGLSIGRYGTAGFNRGAVFSINADTVSGETERELNPNEGVTLRIEVPEGYFVKYTNYTHYIVMGVMLLLTLISFFVWFNYGKDEHVTPVVNFYPPKGLNSAEIELAYKGKASSKGLVALLIELAHEGFIKIEDKEYTFTLEKIHEYGGIDNIKGMFMDSLFERKNYTTSDKLETSSTFYKKCQNIIDKINQKKDKIFYPESIGFPLRLLMFICLAGLILLTIYTISNYNYSLMFKNGMLLLFPIIAVLVLIQNLKNPISGFFTIIWALGFGGMPLLMLISQNLKSINSVDIILGIVCLIIAGVCTYQLPKRNSTGNHLLGNLMGLKHFVEVSEQNRLKQLAEKDPEYFYGVLPCAYILDVSDKWINKFEGIMRINPDWYSGNRFNCRTFNNFAKSVNKLTTPSVENGGISRSSSSGGGGFSGG